MRIGGHPPDIPVIDHERTKGLFRRLDQLLSKSRARPLPERVHQIRTTARRLESVLEVTYPEPTLRVRKMRRGLKRLRRAAGAIRDIDVQIAALRLLKIGREMERKARLMQALAELRREREQKLLTVLQDKPVRKLRRRLQKTATEIDAAMRPAASSTESQPLASWMAFDPVASSLRSFATLVRKTKAVTPENLHALRTSCKRVRYLAEMAGSDPEAKHIVELLKRIQDAAGDWHDWVTLTATAESVFAHDGALTAALRNITQAKFHEARGVITNAKRELMAMYRHMLARQRELKRIPSASAQPARARGAGAA